MKPDPQNQHEKKLRAVVREIKRLEPILRDPPSIPLEEPIQRGWVRRHVFTQEAKGRTDYAILAAILHDIGRVEYSRHPLFLKKKRRRSRKWIEIKQPLHEIVVDRWSTKHHPRPESWKRYFHLEYKPYLGGLQWFYVFSDQHLFVLSVEPHWLTHVSIIDGAIASRDAELRAWMEHHRGWEKYRRLKGRSYRAWNPLRPRLDRKAKQDLRRFRIAPEEAEMKSFIRCLHFSLFSFPHVAQLEGGAPLRTETIRVQILSWGPFFQPTTTLNKESMK